MADFATADDVAARWRPLTSAEQTVATTLVGDASALLRAQYPGIDGQVDATILKMVTASMVKRALVAPLDGVSQESEGVGPYNHSLTFDNPMRNVFITAAEDRLIRGYRPKGGTFGYGNTTDQIGESYQRVYGF